MAASIRDTCGECLGKTGTLHVYSDLFGYPWGRIDRDLSIRRHIENIRARPATTDAALSAPARVGRPAVRPAEAYAHRA